MTSMEELREIEAARKVKTTQRNNDATFIPKHHYNFRLSEKAIDKMYQVFQAFDVDEDGYLLSKDIPMAIRAMGELMHDEKANAMKEQFDPTLRGKIDFTEFVTNMAVYYRDKHQYDELLGEWVRRTVKDDAEIVEDAMRLSFDGQTVQKDVMQGHIATKGDVIPVAVSQKILLSVQVNDEGHYELFHLNEVLNHDFEEERLKALESWDENLPIDPNKKGLDLRRNSNYS